jgi:hypothetical protein
VLEQKLQNGQKLPKWNRWSRLGQFLGYSDEHSSLVANVRHLKTGYISPQYHVVFDDLFESVFISGPNNVVVDAINQAKLSGATMVIASNDRQLVELCDCWVTISDTGQMQLRQKDVQS